MDCNKEEAEKCQRLARRFIAGSHFFSLLKSSFARNVQKREIIFVIDQWTEGDLEKALRFLNKSAKLYPSAEVDDLIAETVQEPDLLFVVFG